MLYACAKSVESELGVKPKKKRIPDKNQKTKWKINVEKDIETMRGEMSRLSEIERNKDPKTRKLRKVIRKYKIANVINIPTIKEELKQKIQVKAQKTDGLINVTNSIGKIRSSRWMPKTLYREMGKNQTMQNPKKLLNGCAREQHTYLLKAMTRKALKTIDQSFAFQQPTKF